MAISDNYTPTRDIGNGSTTVFTFSWNGLNTSFVKVYFEDAVSGVITEQTTGFTKALNADKSTGGSVTFTTAPTASVYVIIARVTPKDQDSSYRTSSGFPAQTVEDNFDKIVAMLQEGTEFEDRAIAFPLGTDVSGLGYSNIMPLPSALKWLRWNSGGTALENASDPTSGADFPGSISAGADASKAASPGTNDVYIATDTGKVYVCFGSSTWTEIYPKRPKRVYTTTSLSTLTPEYDTYDTFSLTALAANLTIANHSTTTPAHGDMIIIDIIDNATPRTLTFGTNYVAKGGIALPTTTTASKKMTLLFMWDAGLSKYNLLALAEEA